MKPDPEAPASHRPADAGQGAPAGDQTGAVERLFPFVLKGKILVIGREALRNNKGRLHFVIIATDIIPEHRDEVLKDLKHYPVVQHYTAAELDQFFGCKGAKAIGFTKSGLAQSIYAGLKAFRINRPPSGPTPPKSSANHFSGSGSEGLTGKSESPERNNRA